MGGLRAGAPGGGKVVDLHMRQVERHGDVAEAAVDTHHALCRAQPVHQGIQPHRRPHAAGRADGRGQALGTRRFCGACTRQGQAPTLLDTVPAKTHPISVGPQLVLTRGAVHQHHQRRSGIGRRGRQGMGRQAEPGCPLGRHAQHLPHQLPAPVQRMDVEGHAVRHIHQPARRGLVARALGAVAQAMAGACGRDAGQPRHQSRLAQALQVDHQVIGLLLQAGLEGPPLGTDRRRPPGLAPAAQGAVQDGVQAFNPLEQGREGRLDHPVDQCIRVGVAQVLHRGHGVHHITQRRELDDQHPHASCPTGCRACTRSPGLSAPRPGSWRRASRPAGRP